MKKFRTLLTVLTMLFVSISSIEAINYPTYKPQHRSGGEFVGAAQVNYSGGLLEDETPMNSSFRSTTSSLSGSSNLPMAAQTGVVTTYDQTEPYSSGAHRVGPRRIGGGDLDEFADDEDGKDVTDPDAPIGATPWILMLLLVGAYAAVIAHRHKEA